MQNENFINTRDLLGALAEAMNHVPDVNGIESQIKPENLFCCMINLQENQEYLKVH